MKRPSIAIVGAGVAGMACARSLAHAQCDVRQFDKGRSPGGRIATRRVETFLGEMRFDHGAQFISARDPAFSKLMEDFALAGAASPWEFDDNMGEHSSPLQPQERRWVGEPGMSTLARAMAKGLAIETSVRVMRVRADSAGWRLDVDRAGGVEAEGPFDAIVVAIPAEQAAPLLAPIAPEQAAEAAAARTAPCWAGLFAFDREFRAPFEVRRSGEPLAWIARKSSKPGRTGPEAWVVHAGPEWSRAHLELTPERASDALWRLFSDLIPEAPQPIWMQAHRWRYALVETPATSRFSWNPALRIGVCGDWRSGPRVEAAWVSGDSLGAAMKPAFDPNAQNLVSGGAPLV